MRTVQFRKVGGSRVPGLLYFFNNISIDTTGHTFTRKKRNKVFFLGWGANRTDDLSLLYIALLIFRRSVGQPWFALCHASFSISSQAFSFLIRLHFDKKKNKHTVVNSDKTFKITRERERKRDVTKKEMHIHSPADNQVITGIVHRTQLCQRDDDEGREKTKKANKTDVLCS